MRHASWRKLWNDIHQTSPSTSAVQSTCLLMIDPISGFFTTKPLLIIRISPICR
ncbi:hypothetical protein YC2023_060698 [Brassica napus]